IGFRGLLQPLLVQCEFKRRRKSDVHVQWKSHEHDSGRSRRYRLSALRFSPWLAFRLQWRHENVSVSAPDLLWRLFPGQLEGNKPPDGELRHSLGTVHLAV